MRRTPRNSDPSRRASRPTSHYDDSDRDLATGDAFEVADILHTIFQSSSGAEQIAEVERVGNALLRTQCEVAIGAEILLHVATARSLSHKLSNRSELEKLVEQSKRRSADRQSADDKRRRRAASILIAFWSRERVEHYNWQDADYKMLEGLIKLADSGKQSWKAFVSRMNCVLIRRHERALNDSKTSKIGSDVDCTCSPVRPTDVRQAQALSKEDLTRQTKQVNLWARQAYEQIAVVRRLKNREATLRCYHVALDKYGLLVPGRKIRDGKSVEKSTGSRSPTTRTDQRSERNNSSPCPESPGNAFPSPTPSSSDEDPVSTLSSMSMSIEDTGFISNDPLQSCRSCGGPCHVTLGEGWPEELQHTMLKAGHDAVSMVARSQEHEIEQWTQHIHFASCRAGEQSASPSMSEDEIEVLFLSKDEMNTRLESGHVFNQPIIIREDFGDSDDYTLTAYCDALKAWYHGQQIQVQHKGSTPTQNMNVTAVVTKLQSDETLNLLSLPNISRAHEPALVRHPRYSLLSIIINRIINKRERTTSKQVRYHDIASCQTFNILGGVLAFSGPHVDALNGTWMRNLFGTKLWFIIPQQLMSEDDLKVLAEVGTYWNPLDKARALLLQAGDVLLMPPGVRVVHAVLTTSTCLMQGGTIWDNRNIPNILRNLHWIATNQQSTNEALYYQMLDVVDELDEMVKAGEFSHFENVALIQELLTELRSLGCTCSRTPCHRDCTCSNAKRRCTPFCKDHSPTGYRKQYSCMSE